MNNMTCNICNSKSQYAFTKKILNKHNVSYFICSQCDFMQTEKPFWLPEAYQEAIGSMDVGILKRNNYAQKIVKDFIELNWQNKSDISLLDYGGGTGLFVRMMRDIGYNFYRQDIYADNIFSRFFDIEDIEDKNKKFEFITAFEVLEHLVNPFIELEDMFTKTDTVFFSTELQPSNVDLKDWWYLSPDGGQHVSFYSLKSLNYIAQKYNATFKTNGTSFHLLTKDKNVAKPFESLFKTSPNIFKRMMNKIVPQNIISRKSLIEDDFAFVISKLKTNNEI